LKQTQESIGKFLALYDSCIKNKTLGVNLLEIQNRIDDLSKLEETVNKRYDVKIKELNVDEARIENMELKKGVNSIISNNRLAIENIKQNLIVFNELLNFISSEYNALQIEINNQFDKISENIEEIEVYEKMRENLVSRKKKVESKLKQVDEKIEEKLNLVINKSYESRKFETEAREFYVRKKNETLKRYEEKVHLINQQINTFRFETCRGKLLTNINKNKIHLSQLLGTLQARVEDYLETEQFKRAYLKVNKRQKNIEQEIKDVNKRNKDLIKEFNKQSNYFETKNKHIIDDFDRFIKEFNDILREKVKSLEELVIKSYIKMAIKAVANEFLTLSFLQNELKIKKQQIQKHLISLISAGKLNGKYNPQIGLYYENPDVLAKLDEKELEVIKKMNFRVYMFIRRLKNFTNQYGSIIAFFASILTISYYIFRLTGENPITILIPVLLTLLVFYFFFFKKRKEDKI
jgi:chromosome segregation ATPase